VSQIDLELKRSNEIKLKMDIRSVRNAYHVDYRAAEAINMAEGWVAVSARRGSLAIRIPERLQRSRDKTIFTNCLTRLWPAAVHHLGPGLEIVQSLR
jgi:hypothetical protein